MVDSVVSTISISLTRSRESPARRLLAELISHARNRGIDQSALARAAGMSPEALSRLKKAGSCRLTTALELARAAGWQTIVLGTPPAASVAASIAARKLSAGRPVPIDAADLVSALAGGHPKRHHRPHLIGFFEELPIEAVHEVVLEAHLDFAQLRSLAQELGAEGETVDWLAEMAGDRVADAARARTPRSR
jgi:hypothetical protein